MKSFLLGAVAALGFATSVAAEDVALFFDPAFVGTAASPGAEAYTLQQMLLSQGHTVSTFSGTSGAAWSAALAGADIVIVPELESGDLFASLDPAAIAAIQAYVQAGGSFQSVGDGMFYAISLLNGLFGYGLSGNYASGTAQLTAAAASTSFAGGPATLPELSLTVAVTSASLPGAATCIYNQASDCWVFQASEGSGSVFFSGWDYYDAAPAGPEDGGWLAVQDTIVSGSSAPVAPAVVPTLTEWAMIILAMGLGGVALLYARRRGYV